MFTGQGLDRPNAGGITLLPRCHWTVARGWNQLKTFCESQLVQRFVGRVWISWVAAIAEMEWLPSEQTISSAQKKKYYRDGRAEWARGSSSGDGFQTGFFLQLFASFVFFIFVVRKIPKIALSQNLLWTTRPNKNTSWFRHFWLSFSATHRCRTFFDIFMDQIYISYVLTRNLEGSFHDWFLLRWRAGGGWMVAISREI